MNAQLEVSENGRHLVDQKGKQFFWLGDTGWALFQKTDRNEAREYIKNRSQQGFSVIHAAVYHDNPFVLPPRSNSYGDLPFNNDDLRQANVTRGNDPSDSVEYDYWDHVEYIVDLAREEGLYILMLPVFGMAEDEGYNSISEGNALQYGRFIGDRFKTKSNIIWCMGGDVRADSESNKRVWNLLARGVTEGVCGREDYSKTLMTFHPRGGSASSDFFTDVPWLDFHMVQTWSEYNSIYKVVAKDYRKNPPKPILHGEGAYEDGPEYPNKPITPLIIRKQAYWAFFAGGMHTYGNSNVWNFGTNPKYVTQNWQDAVKSQGATYLSRYREILESLKWWEFQPDQTLLIDDDGGGLDLTVAMLSADESRILVYFPNPGMVSMDISRLNKSGTVHAFWIDPKTSVKSEKKRISRSEKAKFTVPTDWEDALLLLEAE